MAEGVRASGIRTVDRTARMPFTQNQGAALMVLGARIIAARISRAASRERYLMSKGEPPSARSPSADLFLIGKNSRGNWVVQDPRGMRGGLFVDRTQALKFAMSENGGRPQAVIMVPDGLELDMSAKPLGIERSAESLDAPLKRVA
jgi:hypothetical protein